MLYSVERIEDGAAVLVDKQGKELILGKDAAGFPLREGMMVEQTPEGGFVHRPQIEAERRKQANDLLAGILAKSSQKKAGD